MKTAIQPFSFLGHFTSVSLWALLVLSGTPVVGLSQDVPPEVIDRDRSVRKQSDARSEALDKVKEGVASGSPEVVLDFLGDASGMVRDAVFSRLRKLSGDELEQVVKAWSRHPLRKSAPETRDLIESGLAEALIHQPLPVTADWLLSVASSKKSGEASRELSLAALAQLPQGSLDKKSLRALVRLADKESAWWIRGEALVALSRLDPEAAEKSVSRAWNEKRLWPMRLMSLQAQVHLDSAVAIERATALLAEEIRDRQGVWDGRVERAALQLLGEEVSKLPRAERVETIESLISRAMSAEDVSWHPEIPVLRKLTGVDLSTRRITAWDSWWKSRKKQWLTGGKPTAEKGESAEEEGKTRVVEYHGVPIDSKRIVFVSDVSGGMSRTLDGEFDGSGPRRLEVARKELLRVLDELPAESLVQVMFFASLRIPVLPSPQILARCHKVLKKRINEQGVPQGRGEARGNLYGPLRAAIMEPGIDTVILLTEGAATEGRIHDGDRLCWHVERWNRWSRVRVHVLSVGRLSGGNRAFLEKLAVENGGEFHDIDDRLGKIETGIRD